MYSKNLGYRSIEKSYKGLPSEAQDILLIENGSLGLTETLYKQ